MNQIWESISICRICDSNHLSEVLDLGSQPPANSLYPPNETPPPRIPLRAFFCKNCGCVQLGESVNPEYLFGKYLWVTGTSRTATEYSQRFAQRALQKKNTHKPFVVEVASNDGTFLQEFKKENSDVLGIDPAKNIAELANSNGIPTQAKFFTKGVAEDVLKSWRTVDIAIARNVIPHVKEIHSVISGIKTLISEKGVGIIEFHDSSLLLKELQYDYIYHEHLFYFTLQSIQNLLIQHELYAFDVDRSPISGGSWVVYFSSEEKQKSRMLLKAEESENKYRVNQYESWVEFGEQAKFHRDQLQHLIEEIGEPILAYGASARSSTLLNFAKITSQQIVAIIDRNSLKHKLITPGTSVPVISFEEGIERMRNMKKMLLLAWNFTDEVVEDLRLHGYTGQFIQPLPGLPKVL